MISLKTINTVGNVLISIFLKGIVYIVIKYALIIIKNAKAWAVIKFGINLVLIKLHLFVIIPLIAKFVYNNIINNHY